MFSKAILVDAVEEFGIITVELEVDGKPYYLNVMNPKEVCTKVLDNNTNNPEWEYEQNVYHLGISDGDIGVNEDEDYQCDLTDFADEINQVLAKWEWEQQKEQYCNEDYDGF